MSEQIQDNNPAEKSGGTIQFSLEKTIVKGKPGEMTSEQEEELLKPKAIPTEFEDVFSDAGKEPDESAVEGVVGIEEVFRQKAQKINEDFHNETGEEAPAAPSRLKRAAIVIGIISAAIVLAAIAVGVIILL